MPQKSEALKALALAVALSAAVGIPAAAQETTPAAGDDATTITVGDTATDDAAATDTTEAATDTAATDTAATGGATTATALPRTGVGEAAGASGAVLALLGAGVAAGLAASRRLGRQA